MIRKHSYTTDFGLNISAVSDSLEDTVRAACKSAGTVFHIDNKH